jgi:hypothetical protein
MFDTSLTTPADCNRDLWSLALHEAAHAVTADALEMSLAGLVIHDTPGQHVAGTAVPRVMVAWGWVEAGECVSVP